MNSKRSLSREKCGLVMVGAAYTTYGLLPLYWHQLHDISAELTLLHRVVLTWVLLALCVFVRGEVGSVVAIFRNVKMLSLTAACGALLAANWYIYIWAIGRNQITETGLADFMAPLLSVALGAVLCKEGFTSIQILGTAIMASGVCLKSACGGQFPFVAIALAATFALYLTLRRGIAKSALSSLFAEISVAAPLVIGGLCGAGRVEFSLSHELDYLGLLLLSGPVTVLPLLVLVTGMRGITVQSSAILQYISPSLSLLCGYVLGEQVLPIDTFAFPLVWAGIAVFMFSERARESGNQVRATPREGRTQCC